MTLSDRCYQDMRNQAIRMMRAIGNFAGGCNVQFSVNPANEEIIAIEINPVFRVHLHWHQKQPVTLLLKLLLSWP